MNPKNLYIIAGPNGAGKTTASYTILPDILDCKEFINADEIAKGLSPFQPEKVSFEAGRIMLNRIADLLSKGECFAFETTLLSKYYKKLITDAETQGYSVTLLFFWLESVELAKTRVATRVKEGGHNIEPEVIERRYNRGLVNLLNAFIHVVDKALLFDNSDGVFELIAKVDGGKRLDILQNRKFELLKIAYDTARKK